MRNKMKAVKRAICGLLSVIIMSMLVTEPVYAMEAGDAVLTDTSAKANETTGGVVINPLYADVLDADEVSEELSAIEEFYNQVSFFSDSTVYATEAQAVAYLRSQMVQRAGVIEVKVASSIYHSSMFGDLFEAAMAYDDSCSGQEGDALLGVWSGYKGSISGNSSYYTLEYTITYLSTYDQEEALTEAVDAALEELNLTNDTEYTKVYKIYNYICDNVDYDYTSSGTLKHTAYAAMCNKTAVCQGYALLFYRMCKEAGLSVRYITGTGNGGAHAWNIVKIGDYYYNLDVTWDGQDSTTRSNYFLKSEVDFTNHSRADEYATTEFITKYPMASQSWKNYEEVDEALGKENYEYTFTTIEDTTVSSTASGKPKLIVFYSDLCGYSQGTISSISGADFSDADIIAVNVLKSDKDTVSAFKATYGNDDIVFTYDTVGLDNTRMWEYVRLGGLGSSIYYPVVVYVDSNNVVQYVTQGYYGAGAIRSNLDYYCGGFKVEAGEASASILKGETYQVTTKVNGEIINNAQLTWSTSDAAVATVDANGLVTAVDGGSCTITGRLNDTYSVKVEIMVIAPPATPEVTLENTNKGVLISWNQIENAEGYYVFRREVGGSYSGLINITSGETTSYTDTKSVEGTSYEYAVRAYQGTTQSKFIAKAITCVKSLATPEVTLQNTDTGVLLSWGQIENAEGYYVFRREVGGAYAGLINIKSGETTSYTDAKAVDGTTYEYAVRAYYGTIQSSFVGVTITCETGLGIPEVTLVNTNKGVALSWEQIENAEGYYVFRREVGGSYSGLINIKSGETTDYIDTKAVDGTSYEYAVRAYKGSTQSKFIAETITCIRSLSTPEVTLKSTTAGVVLSWGQIENAEGYYVFRREVGGAYAGLINIKSGETTSYTDTKAVDGTTYEYAVRAYYGTIQSGFVDNVITYTIGLGIPDVTLKSTETGVFISWGQIENAEGYYVFRREVGGSYSGLINIKSGETTSYTDTKAVDGTSYEYAVRAYQGTTQSGFIAKTIIYGKTLGIPNVTLTNTNTGVVLNWEQIENAEGYYVFRREVGGSYSGLINIKSGETISYTDTKAVDGTSYEYAVRAYQGTTQSRFVARTIVCIRTLATPEVTLANTDSGVLISWEQIDNAEGYYVFRREVGGSYSGLINIKNGETTSYTDAKAVDGTSYEYAVRAYMGTIQSAFIAESITCEK